MCDRKEFSPICSELLFFLSLFQGQGPIKSFDGVYRQWFTSRHRVFSLNKGGQVPGHCMKIDGNTVSADAIEKDERGIYYLETPSLAPANTLMQG